jgi:hypothetical protein
LMSMLKMPQCQESVAWNFGTHSKELL